MTKKSYSPKFTNRTHGRSSTSTYKIWKQMRQRCNNPKASVYPYYGGRGIVVCERWSKFENFLADMGERPGRLSLDRINVDGPYSPQNCRWATVLQQFQNKRRLVGLPSTAISEFTGYQWRFLLWAVSIKSGSYRVKTTWTDPVESMITTAVAEHPSWSYPWLSTKSQWSSNRPV